MRIALLGAGRIGKMHAEVPQGIEAVDELLIADPATGAAETLAAELGARAGTVESVLLEPGVPAPADPAWPNFQERFAGAYRDEMWGFFKVAAGGMEPACFARDGVGSTRVIEAATRALREHRIVRLEEIPA